VEGNSRGLIVHSIAYFIVIIISSSAAHYWAFAAFFNFLIVYPVGRTHGHGVSPSQGLYLHTGRHKHVSSGIRTHGRSV
jgi:hypothetical protein